MRNFSSKVFWYALSIAGGGGIAIATTAVSRRQGVSVNEIIVAAAMGLAIGSVVAIVIASYRFPLTGARWIYLRMMRSLARRALRASMYYALTPIECLGILDRDGTVALRVDIGWSSGVRVSQSFDVYESTDSRLWGRVSTVEVDQTTCVCEPVDRANPEFWRGLEDRMNVDTSPPLHVYLTQSMPSELLQIIDHLLDSWR